ncbi:OsmC family protein [Thermococcus celer]|uniref:Osmotically inducible protein OsmC n=1 Tax=Thermococcus celer Vu 13 = JCM 8558 TaxID=1293037 RepID=A0A218P0X8_THECE|nr:OsmC family protein [Thermococcus celer]ASI98553.1 osmotically inducible protein OsmC [Thermococcus celer Vu 13 = JCM 8558]
MERLEYKAELEWDGNVGSEARVREFAFFIDTNTDGNNRGPNPTEMLLSAIGGCLMVNWGRLIKKMRLDVKALNVEVRGWRGLEEPQLKEITYKITITTGEDEKKILRVKELAEKYGTVFNTVGAEKIKGEVEIVRP